MKESDSEHVFHFTRSIENLTSIIHNEEFWVCYSLESFDFLNAGDPLGGQIKESFAYPITCFCDIPLNERILNHANDINGYGVFGIGMKKEWAKRNGVAPVHYVPDFSHVSKLWCRVLGGVDNVINLSKEPLGVKGFYNDLISLGTYIKPYTNDAGKFFYDEREWRYYPPVELFDENRIKRFLTEDEYKKAKHENSTQSVFELKYSLKHDVAYLVVPKAHLDEIYGLIDGLEIKIQLYEEIGIQ